MENNIKKLKNSEKISKEDLKLKNIVEEMNGKSKEEIINIMLREGILVPVQKVRSEFKFTQNKEIS